MKTKPRTTTATPPLRCILYARISSDEERQKTSHGSQIERGRAYVESICGTVVAEFRESHSGFYRDRPDLNAARAMLRAGQADALVCFAVDRLTRHQTDLGVFVEEAEAHGFHLLFVTEKLEDTAMGRAVRSLLIFGAELEREKRVEQTTRGLATRAKKGQRIPGPRACYGYDYAGDDKDKLRANPITGPVVRRIFAEAARGMPLRAIAKGLTADGIPTPNRADCWSYSTVRKFLVNETYTGVAYALKYKAPSKRVNGAKVVKVTIRPESEWVRLPDDAVEALIDAETFIAVTARLDKDSAIYHSAPRRHGDPEGVLLRGFARCGYCGGALYCYRTRHGKYTFRCQNAANGRSIRCPSFGISTRLLDSAIWNRVEAALCDTDSLFDEAERGLNSAETVDPDLSAVEARIATATRQRDNLQRLVTRLTVESLDPEAADLATAPHRAEVLRLSKELIELEAERTERAALRVSRDQTAARIRAMRAQLGHRVASLADLSYHQKRDVLDLLGLRIKVYRTDHTPRVEVTGRIDLDKWAHLDTLPVYGELTDRTAIDLSRVEYPRYAKGG